MKQRYRLANAATALLGLSLVLAGQSAQAAPGINAGAAVSNSRLTVIDLTPEDGAVAGYTVISASTNVLSGIDSPGVPWTQHNDAQGRLEPLAVTTSYAGSTVGSSADKFGEVRTNAQVYDNIGNRGNAAGDVRQLMSLTVAPHTQLIYSGYGEVSISDARQYGRGTFVGEAVTQVQFGDEFWKRGMMQGVGSHADSGVRSGEFSLSFYNNSDTVQYTYVSMITLTRAGYFPAAPVPEPATYAMFALGTLMVGAIARRQRRRQRAA
ncbi:PEP-CTERM sorting domain-containing protein [Massilia sp. P8910]|uniref:PEP-CTERM sorting domain-containing protein n=1 Tax=Massilia antarctica TaxID=2765360 RepID=UPI001E625AB6|nr:PEP-CTERM sorting domain-containing protein [Massilia antarctica]MCE3607130.1 PEP-CTERM sorting domain-containing protein [Massilia antarctica]